jgi:hypothetical protein
VPPGWTAPSEGYFLDRDALSDLSAAAKTYRLERDAWEASYLDLSVRYDDYVAASKLLLTQLREQIDTERDARRREARKARSPGVGIFAGGAWTPHGIEAAVGVGLVWKVW